MSAWLAQFSEPSMLLEAARALRARDYRRLEAFSPFSIDGLADAVGIPAERIPVAMLIGGILGGAGTLALEYYSAVIDFPINIGGRPDASWPAFVPAALEMTVLWAVLFGVCAFFVSTGLPRLHHPLFASARFEAASRDGFFLLVPDAGAPEAHDVRRDLDQLHPVHLERIDT